jgi:long-chain acyl-CoA synthetase
MNLNPVWLKSYPEGVPADIDPGQYSSLVGLLEESFSKYSERGCCSCSTFEI